MDDNNNNEKLGRGPPSPLLLLLIAASVVGFGQAADAVLNNAETPITLNPDGGEQVITAGGTLKLKCKSSTRIKWHTPGTIEAGDVAFDRSVKEATLIVRGVGVKAVGYYACMRYYVNDTYDVHQLKKLERLKQAKLVYVYVDGLDDLLTPGIVDELQVFENSSYVVPCKPTSPNVHVKLFDGDAQQAMKKVDFDQRRGYLMPKLVDLPVTRLKCEASRNGVVQIREFNVTILKEPKIVRFEFNNFVLNGTTAMFICEAQGYPLPTVKWFFGSCVDDDECQGENVQEFNINEFTTEKTDNSVISNLTITSANQSGTITCRADNRVSSANETAPMYVTDVENGFDILPQDDQKMIYENDNVTLTCAISIYIKPWNISWYRMPENELIEEDNDEGYNLSYENAGLSHRLILSIPFVSKNHSGEFACRRNDDRNKQDIIVSNGMKEKQTSLDVKDTFAPTIVSNMNNSEVKYVLGEQNIQFYCSATGSPQPSIRWYKNNDEINSTDDRVYVDDDGVNLNFKFIRENDKAKYSCWATNRLGVDYRYIVLDIQLNESKLFYVAIFAAFCVLICIISILIFKIRKEKTLKNDLYRAGLIHFEKGAIECINPDLGIDEQAELLPYEVQWEFPREKLKMGKQLGSGAFGVVMKAAAEGIIDIEESTTVAVKMVKKTADPILTRALVSELKVMVHLGKHLNIVNLLGACTTDLINRELMVIVEYCQYGNIHNYLLRQRQHFVNQINLETDMIDYSIKKKKNENHDSFSIIRMSNITDDVGINSSNQNTTCDTSTTSPTNEAQPNTDEPEWRSNLRGDYNYKKTKRSLSTDDLISWSYQIASGLDYLAYRNILHGDLAARNILLGSNNVVKICDFGLAKRMYKSHNYKKKGNSPLPIKWMAIESIRDRVFSTQSDVWAYGVVLWELFSLGCSPYPGMEADEKLYNKLVDGYRMNKPQYANKAIHNIMLECWRSNPTQRPKFEELIPRIGTMLNITTKNCLMERYEVYNKINKQWLAERKQNDYLAAMCSPDYVSFSINPKHDYVNGPFGGSSIINPLSPDDERNSYYLQMQPFHRNAEPHYKIPSAIFIEIPTPAETSQDVSNGIEAASNDLIDVPIPIQDESKYEHQQTIETEDIPSEESIDNDNINPTPNEIETDCKSVTKSVASSSPSYEEIDEDVVKENIKKSEVVETKVSDRISDDGFSDIVLSDPEVDKNDDGDIEFNSDNFFQNGIENNYFSNPIYTLDMDI